MMAHTPVPKLMILMGMGALSSLLFQLIFTGTVFGYLLSLACQAPFFYIFLTQDTRSAGQTVIFACITLALFIGMPASLFFGLFLGLPALILIRCLACTAMPQDNPRLTQNFMALFYYGALVMTLFFGLLEIAFARGLATEVAPLLERLAPGFDKEKMLFAMRLSPGTATFIFLSLTLSCASLTQAMMAKRATDSTQSTLNLEHIQLPMSFWVLFVASAFCAFFLEDSFVGPYCLNLLLVLATLFLVQGLSVLHAYCRNRPRKIGVLWTFYALVVMFPHVAFVIALVGLFEPFIQIRRRIYEKMRR